MNFQHSEISYSRGFQSVFRHMTDHQFANAASDASKSSSPSDPCLLKIHGGLCNVVSIEFLHGVRRHVMTVRS
jgi:hypothetical protein